ncbi:alpha/beta hydrolase [Saccharopolyspora spinosporotrichia]
MRIMSAFVLVHGAWHGAWCWERLTPLLTERGHTATAVELPITEPEAGLTEYAAAVSEAVGDGGDVVLVGHSLGGLPLPLVASRVPLRHMVFVCGLITPAGMSMRELTRGEDVFAAGWSELARRQLRPGDGSSQWPPDAAIEAFYHDCADDVARAAAARLSRQFWRFQTEPNPVAGYPEAPATYVLCRQDRVINPDWSRRAAPALLGTPAVEMAGGHSPQLSRPAELADLLHSLVS